MTEKPDMRQLTVRLPADVFDRLAELADAEQRSLSNTLRLIATRYLETIGLDAPSE